MNKLLLCCLILILILSACGPAAEIQLASADLFVYPSGDSFILVLAAGEYTIAGESAPPGCYRLSPPALFQSRGSAEYIGEECAR